MGPRLGTHLYCKKSLLVLPKLRPALTAGKVGGTCTVATRIPQIFRDSAPPAKPVVEEDSRSWHITAFITGQPLKKHSGVT